MVGQVRETEVVVVGGGQAGLAVGRQLQIRGLEPEILDAGDGPGAAWRERWDSLRLFTPAAFSGLPGLAFPGPADALPTKDEVADYLAAYAAHFELAVRWGVRVYHLTRRGPGFAVSTTAGDRLAARAVVLATGAHQRPWRPNLGSLDDTVRQLHTAGYRNPGQLRPGPVLVVGGGNSGVQVAAELARTRPVTLSVGTHLPALPARIAGRSVFVWLEAIGALRIPAGGALGRRAAARGDALIGVSPAVLRRRDGVRLAPRVVAAHGDVVNDVDGGHHFPASVIWATGFRQDLGWAGLPGAIDDHGGVMQRRGVTPVPGLFTVGLPWQSSSGSAILHGVGRDAAAIADCVVRSLRDRSA